VWTTFDSDLYPLDAPVGESPNGQIVWVELNPFSPQTLEQIRKSLPRLAQLTHSLFVFAVLGGHPRSIELFEKSLKFHEQADLKAFTRKELINQMINSISSWYTTDRNIPTLQLAEFDAVMNVFTFPRQVELREKICKDAQYTWEDLIGWCLLLNSHPGTLQNASNVVPLFHLIILRLAFQAMKPKHDENLTRQRTLMIDLWNALFLELPHARSDSGSVENIHLYFECLRHTLRATESKKFTLSEHYRQEGSELFYCCHGEPSCFMDKAKDYTFYPSLSPLEEVPEVLSSKQETFAFLAGRHGARLGMTNQPGFDSALWVPAMRPNEETPTFVLFLFENKLSAKDDKALEGREITPKLKLIRKSLKEYNEADDAHPQILEENVVVVFPVLRGVRHYTDKTRLHASEWGGTLIILNREHLVNNFYTSAKAFFEIMTPGKPLEGQIVAIVGNQEEFTDDFSKENVQEQVEDLGGQVNTRVTSKVTLVIAPPQTQSRNANPLKTALHYSIPVKEPAYLTKFRQFLPVPEEH